MDSFESYIIPYFVSNLVFGMVLIAAFKRPMFARIFFIICFAGAGIFNALTAFYNPAAYLTYADTTPVLWYENFIRGYFSSHVLECVVAIGFGQILVGVGLTLDNRWTRLACIGGITFGVAIAPLGVGSAFPSTIVMALALAILLRRHHDFIWKWEQYQGRDLVKPASA
jgi:hypothetical protein